MGKSVKLSESDMNTLSEEFTTCREKAREMAISLSNIKTNLVDEVYSGLTTTCLRCSLENMYDQAVELFCVYESLRLYVEATLEDFKTVDKDGGDDIENNVATAQQSAY
ncbi:hypothetical protein SAMN02745247_00212 [Butyrivibrio hungatei DSM 14810]|uniref:Uncharacterized protein n=1 Tax=Butyrivibrio hungatei DSM 14810 TaxID=1121132 RepID=A0A1M7RS42_9FIRM|nr:hypothetical protein [Butyrivibrio hungatei]SHN48990.1 hypothetical protein SAMN02745247_00212 [Butyrivibrio hungatei DSM 14810]